MPSREVILALIVNLALPACWSGDSSGGSGDGGADADGDADTDVDSDADGDSDSDSDVDTDTSPPVTVQDPVTFVVTNNSSQPIYLQGQSSFYGEPQFLTCLYFGADISGDPCRLFTPECAYACEEIDEGDSCCVDCEYWPIMIQLLPDESTMRVWEGWLREVDWDHCDDGCECYVQASPGVGAYEIGVEYWLEIDCLTDDGVCPDPDSFGYIDMAEPVGDPEQVVKDFEVVYEGGVFEIVVE